MVQEDTIECDEQVHRGKYSKRLENEASDFESFRCDGRGKFV